MVARAGLASVVLLAATSWSAATSPPAGAESGPFRFADGPLTTSEGQAMVRVVVERTDLPVSRAVLEYRTEAGTAKPGEDYLESTGRLVFEVGQTSAVFAVFLRDDSIVEPPEQFVLRLASGAQTFDPATVTILDDDEPPSAASVGSAAGGPSAAGPMTNSAAARPGAATPPVPATATASVPAAVASAAPHPPIRRRPRTVAGTRRVTVRQSPVTPFELRPAAPDDVTASGPPLAIDPLVAMLAGLLLARVAAEVWFRTRPALA